MRPIDADAVLEKVLSIPPYCGHCDGYGFVQLDMVEDAIDESPTIEAEPVKHGWWKTYFYGKELMCSVCKATFWDENGNGGSNYCPNCGAKMDLEET